MQKEFRPWDVVTPEWIAGRMQAHGLTQTALCTALAVTRGDMSKYLSGNKPISRVRQQVFYYFFAVADLVGRISEYAPDKKSEK